MVFKIIEHSPYNVQVFTMAAKMPTAHRTDKMLNSRFSTFFTREKMCFLYYSTNMKIVLKFRTSILHYTVKTLYNVTHYNRIFNIRHKFAGNGSVSIKIPSL